MCLFLHLQAIYKLAPLLFLLLEKYFSIIELMNYVAGLKATL